MRILHSMIIPASIIAAAAYGQQATEHDDIFLSTESPRCVVGYTQFDVDNVSTPMYGLHASAAVVNSNNGNLTVTGNNAWFNGAKSGGGRWTMSIAVRVDLDRLSNVTNQIEFTPLITTYLAENTNTHNDPNFGLGIIQDGNDFKLVATNDKQNQASILTTDALPTSGELNIVLCMGDRGVTIYFGEGEDPDYSTNSTNSLKSSTTGNQTSIGPRDSGKIEFHTELLKETSQLYVFKDELTTDQIQELMSAMTAWASPVAVPEPTTAVLSLAGLAGLCVCRSRRK